MYCKNCGNEIDDSAVVCTKCGCATDNMQNVSTKPKQKSGKYIASLVFLIISLCANGISFILALTLIGANSSLGFINSFFIVPISVCTAAITQLNKATTKKDLTAISIVTLIFGNIIAGIIMLTMNDEDLQCNK